MKNHAKKTATMKRLTTFALLGVMVLIGGMMSSCKSTNDPNLCPPAIKQEVMEYVNSCL